MIYRGEGGDYSPYTPKIDELISTVLKQRGYKGSRSRKKAHFGSTSKEQAIEYTANKKEGELKVLLPQKEAVVSWAPGTIDMILSFSSFLRNSTFNEDYWHQGMNCEALMIDIAGDVGVAETYLSLGRQKNKIGRIINNYLSTIEIKEETVQDPHEIEKFMEGHNGEVWITGDCRSYRYQPESEQLNTMKL